MKKIDVSNKIFLSKEFQNDKYKFYLILQNLKSDEVLLCSDEENYVICRGKVGFPTWIWTKDNFDKSKLGEIKEAIKYYLVEGKNKFTAKPELYNLLKNFEYLNKDDYFEMGTLHCKKTIRPKQSDGKICKAISSDKDVLYNYWYLASNEMKLDPKTKEEAKKDVDKMLESGNLYVWKNDQDKIVSMVYYSVVNSEAKLSHVYTPVEERAKGYAANLIYSVTNLILEDGLTPLLYTDYNYIPSNKAYKNAGYIDTGILINFSCNKEIERK